MARGRKDLQAAYRVLDANLNRCREGLRVLEDTARFVWNEKRSFEALRSARHLLDRASRGLHPDLVRARDSRADEGRGLKESGRRSLSGVAAANFRRCQESLRVLEEYGKLFSAGAGARFKRIRFRIYDLEKDFFKSDHGN